jgi:hypothetical protein
MPTKLTGGSMGYTKELVDASKIETEEANSYMVVVCPDLQSAETVPSFVTEQAFVVNHLWLFELEAAESLDKSLSVA